MARIVYTYIYVRNSVYTISWAPDGQQVAIKFQIFMVQIKYKWPIIIMVLSNWIKKDQWLAEGNSTGYIMGYGNVMAMGLC